jgi:hypothetical protein
MEEGFADEPIGFVTIAEAARALGIGERRAYRLSDRLEVSDVSMSDSGKKTVNIKSLSKLIENPVKSVKSDKQPSDSKRVSDTSKVSMSDSAESVSKGSQDDLVEQLRSENAFLRSALEREQQNTARALDQLQEAENRSKTILGAIATGRIDASATGQISPNLTTGSPETNATGRDDTLPTQNEEEPASARRWWQIWK